MSYEKIDKDNVKEIKPVATIHNIPERKNRKAELQNDIIRMQEEIAQIDAFLLEVEKLEVK